MPFHCKLPVDNGFVCDIQASATYLESFNDVLATDVPQLLFNDVLAIDVPQILFNDVLRQICLSFYLMM